MASSCRWTAITTGVGGPKGRCPQCLLIYAYVIYAYVDGMYCLLVCSMVFQFPTFVVMNYRHIGVSINRGTPSHHPFLHGILSEKKDINRGTPMTIETPIPTMNKPYFTYLQWATSQIGGPAFCGRDHLDRPGYPMGKLMDKVSYESDFSNHRINKPGCFFVFQPHIFSA